MNPSSLHGSPSAENPIASKKPDAKLRKRPEDEVPADSAATDQEVLLAQAAPDAAAEGSASAGGGTPEAAAQGSASAGDSAGAGAGAPVLPAAPGGLCAARIGPLAPRPRPVP